jgi:hypothetical protein
MARVTNSHLAEGSMLFAITDTTFAAAMLPARKRL